MVRAILALTPVLWNETLTLRRSPPFDLQGYKGGKPRIHGRRGDRTLQRCARYESSTIDRAPTDWAPVAAGRNLGHNASTASEAGCIMSSLFEKRFILVCGKGGVGRSTVAAAIAKACAQRGRNTLLFETNANDRFGAYFGKPPVSTNVVPLAPNLSAVNTTPAAALAEYGLMILKFKTAYEMVFENRVTKAFLRAIPGLDDYALLGKAWFHTTEEKRGKPVWDTVVFDMPASGHSLSMLRIPKVILETVPEGPLTRDARTLQSLLIDPARTAAVIVTLAEEMPSNEARELSQKLSKELNIKTQHVVVNQVYPGAVANAPTNAVLTALDAAEGALIANPQVAALHQHSRLVRDRFLLNQTYLAQLKKDIEAPLCELPMIFRHLMTTEDIGALSDLLTKSMTTT
jgi:anion-transporting  ArsA/GET3 family ATPase